ncbi:MAG: hypothetical protein ACM339_09510 [Ignavibacteria bacterium]
MENSILSCIIFLVAFLLGCKDSGVEPQPETEYYWAGGDKIVLNINYKTVIGVYHPDSTHPKQSFEILYFDSPQKKSLHSIMIDRGFDPDLFEWISFGYTYNEREVLPTNRISFHLKIGYTFNNLQQLIQDEAVFDSTNFGTVMLKVAKQDGNVFKIANKVQESGFVEYSLPDFIANITYY